MTTMFEPGTIVIAHLVDPSEKLWGPLKKLDAVGLVMDALQVSSFDDWMYQAAKKESSPLGLSTLFVPSARIERIYLDQRVGQVESYSERFERQTGLSVETYLAD